MELYQVRYFMALCDTLNFTKAAGACHVTQPTLTRAISKLEEDYGAALFHRSKSGAKLSEFGRLMRPYFESTLEMASQARRRADAYTDLTDAPLRIGIMCTVGPEKLVPVFEEFSRENPGVVMELCDGDHEGLAAMLIDGQLDVAIMCCPEECPAALLSIPLYRERFLVAVWPGHRFEDMKTVRFADLAGENYLCRVNCEYQEQVEKIWHEQDVAVNCIYRTGREDWILSLIRSRIGIGLFPEHSISGGVVTRPVSDPAVERQVFMATVRGRRHTAAVGAWINTATHYREPR